MKATGEPQVALTIGTETRLATFTGWGSDSLYFDYTVQAGDRDEDGISIAANALELNGGTITAADGTTDADLTHDAVPAAPALRANASLVTPAERPESGRAAWLAKHGDRVKDKVEIVTGAGPAGPGWGNGKAAAVLSHAREPGSSPSTSTPAAAEETRRIVADEGGTCSAAQVDVTDADAVRGMVAQAIDRYGASTSCTTTSASPRWAARRKSRRRLGNGS